jgi:hypothetical protein
MFLYCPFDRKPDVARRLTELGAEVVPIAFAQRGMESWAWSSSGIPAPPF